MHWLSRDMLALKRMPPAVTTEHKLERLLTDLAVKRGVSGNTQAQAFNAIMPFYKDVLDSELQDIDALRATRAVHLRHAPTVAETRSLLNGVRDISGYPTSPVVRLLYGCGLRVTEPLNLRIKDLNLEGGQLFILGANLVALVPSGRVTSISVNKILK